MSYSIIPTSDFKTTFKRLAKKYKSLKSDIAKLYHLIFENTVKSI